MNIDKLNVCPITHSEITDKGHTKEGFYYTVAFLGRGYRFEFCQKCFDKIDFAQLGHIVCSHFLNGFLSLEEEIIHWDPAGPDGHKKENLFSLKTRLEESPYPRDPDAKLSNLFARLCSMQNFDGQRLKIPSGLWHFLYFRNRDEFKFYLNTLESMGYIDKQDFMGGQESDFSVTYSGLEEQFRMKDEGATSRKCFVAMAFRDETLKAREAIRKALIRTRFEPVIMDEQQIPSDTTINDEQIANLRKCKFCIADFTHHRQNVYFETGFALGLGKQVIYTCAKEHFENSPFDVRPLQHIIYSSADELEESLVHKIEAWIA